jgi:hypothetical protein
MYSPSERTDLKFVQDFRRVRRTSILIWKNGIPLVFGGFGIFFRGLGFSWVWDYLKGLGFFE